MSFRPKNFRTFPRGIVVINTDNIVSYCPTGSGEYVAIRMKAGNNYEVKCSLGEFELAMFGEPDEQVPTK